MDVQGKTPGAIDLQDKEQVLKIYTHKQVLVARMKAADATSKAMELLRKTGDMSAVAVLDEMERRVVVKPGMLEAGRPAGNGVGLIVSADSIRWHRHLYRCHPALSLPGTVLRARRPAQPARHKPMKSVSRVLCNGIRVFIRCGRFLDAQRKEPGGPGSLRSLGLYDQQVSRSHPCRRRRASWASFLPEHPRPALRWSGTLRRSKQHSARQSARL